MMRVRTGHGPQDWQDIGEGYAGSIPLRGSLVVGGPAVSIVDDARREKLMQYKRRQREKARAGKTFAQCHLSGRCQHAPCTSARRIEARRLYQTGMTLRAIGEQLGGRDHSTIAFMLRDRVA